MMQDVVLIRLQGMGAKGFCERWTDQDEHLIGRLRDAVFAEDFRWEGKREYYVAKAHGTICICPIVYMDEDIARIDLASPMRMTSCRPYSFDGP